MVDKNEIQQFAGSKLNLDTHPSLLKSGDLIYLLNGDIEDNQGNDWFVQNVLGNELCYEFPDGHIYKNSIKLNGSDHAVFFKTTDSYEIGLFNVETCDYTVAVSGNCLNLEYPVRGVYKFNNSENDRRIYFIDGNNSNRYLDIDKALNGEFPQTYLDSLCDTCNPVPTGELDCNSLCISKMFTPFCVNIEQKGQGQLPSGVYQVAIAGAMDNLILTDYYFSPAIKAFSESSNISINVDIQCSDDEFEQYSLILITNTRENSLVAYNIGFFNTNSRSITINNLNNATIISIQEVSQKKLVFDISEHIATNGEILVLGKHQAEEILNYQPQANEIEIEWVELKVPKTEAHKYPSFLRDEVYTIGLEWFSKKGYSKSKSTIPGRESEAGDLIEYTSDDFDTNDIYETSGCSEITLERWQIENTASVTETYDIGCDNCSGAVISKVGLMGYWESENFVYPNDSEIWGDLACQPIRHHRMPSHDLTHLHDDFTTEVTESDPEDCYTVEVTDQEGETVYSYEYCPSGNAQIVESDCVNILTIRLKNITHPLLSDGVTPDPDIAGFRVLIGDRQGNKSILHKGLIFNTWADTSTEQTTIYYPNYPFNDLFPDVFLSSQETVNNPDGSISPNWLPPGNVQRQHFTYHSPDIHFRETKQEFGTELKVYGESIGWIDGEFGNVYQHPQTRFSQDLTTGYTNHAAQLNSVCHYSAFEPWSTDLFSRFEILSSQYLLPINQILSNGKKFNNHYRETSYYVELGRQLQDPTNVDVSRLIASEAGYFGQFALPKFDYFNQVYRRKSGVNSLYNLQGVSYYVGIKIKQPNQYGSVDQISYRPVTCIIPVDGTGPYETDPVFGGDVFISKHSTLRKMPIFTEWLEDVSIDTEINYRDYRNLWYPRFWYDNLTQTDDQYNLDGFSDTLPGSDVYANGKFYVFVTGVIDYWCESEFIGDYREQDFTLNGSFYPKQSFTDLARTDRIPLDNKYLYNLVLLNNEIERLFQNINPTQSDADFIVSYSLKNDFQSQDDKWLQFLPLNYSILPRIYGKFTGIHYTDDYSLLFAFENEVLYSQLDYRLETNEGSSILLSQGDIFTNRLRKLSNELTGFTGCVDPLSFVNTRYGTYYVDRYRKKFLHWNGQNIQDVTDTMKSWLQHFLTTTNPGYNNSIISVFDNYTNNIYLTDRIKQWTLSYKPKLQAFISFHSFVPEFYMADINTFLSIKSGGIWKHNKEFLYQSYYDTEVPFEVGVLINNQFINKELQSVELFAEFIKASQYGAWIYKKDKFFDKLFAYNNNGSTGLMDILLKNKNNPSPVQQFIQNQGINTPAIAEVTQVNDSIYRFNKFEDFRVDHANQPLVILDSTGMLYTPQSIDFTKPPNQRNDLKGKWTKLHLRSDDNTDHKIILQLIIPNQHNNEI